MTITYVCPPSVHNEPLMVRALLHHFDYRVNACFANVYLMAWESDLIVMSPASYVTEIEIKVSWADWKSDALKDKWGVLDLDRYWNLVKRFFYAVPLELYEKHGIPDNLRPEHGVLVVSPRKHGRLPEVVVVREAKINTKAKPLPENKAYQLYRSTYFKYTMRLAEGK